MVIHFARLSAKIYITNQSHERANISIYLFSCYLSDIFLMHFLNHLARCYRHSELLALTHPLRLPSIEFPLERGKTRYWPSSVRRSLDDLRRYLPTSLFGGQSPTPDILRSVTFLKCRTRIFNVVFLRWAHVTPGQLFKDYLSHIVLLLSCKIV